MNKIKLIFIYTLFILRLTILLPVLPIIYIIGKKTKKNVPELPEATKNIKGHLVGNLTERKVLLIGESSIAGVGINDHIDGIPGELGRTLKANDRRGITWQVIAKSGYKASDVFDQFLSILPNDDFDFIIIGLGGNDTFQMTTPWTWRKTMINILTSLKKSHPSSMLVISGMPPIADFVAFPYSLKSFLGGHANLLRHTISDLPQQFSNTVYLHQKVKITDWIEKDSTLTVSDFFSDGVHPSKLTYQLIGKEIAYAIIREKQYQ